MVEKPPPVIDDETESAEPKEEAGTKSASLRSPRIKKLIDRCAMIQQLCGDFIWNREPHLWPSLITLISVLMLLGMGFWQMHRLAWKNDILNNVRTALESPVTDMRNHYPRGDAEWKKYDYRPVVVKGTWLSVHGFKMIPRTYEGQVGYHLILPLKLSNNDVVFVNRGFVPDNGAILPPSEEKVFAVQGVLRLPETRKTWATPENDPSRGVWTWNDLAAMRHEIGVNSAAPMILYEAKSEARDTYPIGGQLPVPMFNRHKQYALIWFALALAFMVIWMIGSSPKEKLKATDETTAANDDDRANDPVARRGMYPEATD